MPLIHVLLVGVDSEHATELRKALALHLESEYRLIVAGSYEEAIHIQSIGKQNLDVILIGSPVDMAGYCRLIQVVQEQNCVQPIIVLETNTENPAEFDYLKNGADFYLKKWRHDADILNQTIMAAIERVKAFQAIKNSERRMRGIYYWSSIGILLVDLDDLIVQNNPAFSRIVGFTPHSSSM